MTDDVLVEAHKRFTEAETAELEDRTLADMDFAFAAGEQWPEAIKLERKNRPCLTINRLPQFIQQVVGEARQNSPSIKVHPVDSGADIETAKIYQGLIRNIEAQSSAQSAYMTALEHATTGGFGHWRVVTGYSDPESFDQDIRIERIISPFSVSWDPNAKRYDRSDAGYCFVHEWVTQEYFEIQWPDQTPADWEVLYAQNNYGSWKAAKRVRIAEYWRKVPKKKTIALLQNGEVVDVTDIKEFAVSGVIPTVKTKVVDGYVLECWKMSGHAVLEPKYTHPGKYIPVVSVFGPEEVVSDRIRHRSLIRNAIDAQRMYNFWQSSITEKIALAPKSPFIGTVEQFAGIDQWNSANTDNKPFLPYNNVPGVPQPQRQAPAAVNEAEIIQARQAVDDMKATMGIYDASLGNKGNETSGRAIFARQNQANTGNSIFVDNLAQSIEHTGRILVDLIPKIYDTARVVRVLGEDDSAELVPINQVVNGEMLNDLSVGKYDVVVTTGPSYATKRMEAVDDMMSFINSVPQVGQVAGDIIASNMDWPGADELAARLKKTLPPGLVDPAKMKPEEQQAYMMAQQKAQQDEAMGKAIAMDKVRSEIEKQDADAKLALAEADKVKSETQAQLIENAAVAAKMTTASVTQHPVFGVKDASASTPAEAA